MAGLEALEQMQRKEYLRGYVDCLEHVGRFFKRLYSNKKLPGTCGECKLVEEIETLRCTLETISLRR